VIDPEFKHYILVLFEILPKRIYDKQHDLLNQEIGDWLATAYLASY